MQLRTVILAALVALPVGAAQAVGAFTGDAANRGSRATAATSFASPTVVTPSAQAAPAIGGVPAAGELLTVTPGRWSGETTMTHRWQRCAPACADLPGASGTTYRLTDDDAGATIRVVERATAGGTSATATSEAVGPVRTRYAHLVLSEQPAAYWPLDEASGASFADLAGGPTASLVATGTPGVLGVARPATALALTGRGLTVPSTPATTPADAFSVELWFRPATTGDAVLASKTDDAFADGYLLDVDTGRIRMRVARGGTRALAAGPLVTAGRWHHVVATHTGSQLRLFVNGIEHAATTAARPGTTTAPTQLGRMTGTLDEVSFHRRALSAADVSRRWQLLRANAGY